MDPNSYDLGPTILRNAGVHVEHQTIVNRAPE